MKKPVIVADAGPLIALGKCGQLALLPQVFGDIHLPHAVLREAAGNSTLPGALAVSSFVEEFARFTRIVTTNCFVTCEWYWTMAKPKR